MSQDQLNLIAPEEEENTEEIQQLPVEAEENTPEMAMQLGLPPPEPLDLSGGNISANWKKFKQKYTNYEIATGISSKASSTRVATLLTVIGNDAIDVFNTLTWDAEGDDKKIEKVLLKFEEHCEPKKNVSYERYKFFSRAQESGESIDQYVTILRKLCETCEFGTLKNSLIKDRIVLGVNNTKTRERLLRVPDLTLEKALDVVRSAEATEIQMKELDSDSSVHGIGKDKNKSTRKKTSSDDEEKRPSSKTFNCWNRGTRHGSRECPAYGKTCNNCQKQNHFQSVCRSRKKVHRLGVEQQEEEHDLDSTLFVGAVTTEVQIQNEECFVMLPVKGHITRLKIDTGSQVNIMPLKDLKKIVGSNPQINTCNHNLVSYSEDKLTVLGTAKLPVKSKTDVEQELTFHIVETNQPGLLGLTSSQDLGLIKVVMMAKTEEKQTEPDQGEEVTKSSEELREQVLQKYAQVFTGLGRMEKPYHIEVDPTVTPVINLPRTIPAALHDRVKEELDDMEKRGVVRKVEEPTDWVNSMAIVEKPNGSLRICLDPRHLNKAIKREHFQLPTIEDITTRMANAKWFTKLDANRGYWQIPLDEESQLLTTFNTPFGRYCYQVTPFGITSAQEVFQKRMSQHFGDLEGVETDIDDIIVHAETEVKHDHRLQAVLERCEKINLTLNKEKCVFKVKEVTYIGHKLTQEGIKPDDEKVRAINDMPAPTDKKGVERLLGTVNYLGKFIPNLATVTEPFRVLLRKDIEFQWSHEQDKALQEIKSILTKDGGPVLRFFDVQKPVTISCDASPTGLGGVLLQDQRPVAYASRSLTDAESRYAQIEKELLAVQFSLERFNQYTYGKRVTIESDHKPLEAIVKKALASAPPRLQRILLRMQKYDYMLEYKPGKELVLPDMLSRAPLPETANGSMEEEIALHVHLLTSNLPVSKPKLEEIKRATADDPSLKELKETIKSGWPETKSQTPANIQIYWNVRDELSEVEGILLKNDRIIVPPSMRKEMLQRIHQGHMGIEKSKRRARDVLYWPGMNSQISDMISRCTICLQHQRQNTKEPMIPSRIPSKPWEVVATDLFTWDKSEYLIIVDYHSRYFEVAKLPNTKSTTVITYTKSMFARHGIPSEVISDNGPQYASKDFSLFAEQWEFKHTTVSPRYPQANGLVEKEVQTVKNILTKAKQDRRDPYLGLLEYRNTPIDDVGSPAQLLMSRRLRLIIPTTDAQLQPKVLDPHKVKEKLRLKQEKQKHYFDQHAKHLPTLEKGDRIRVQMGSHWKPGVVTEHAGTPRSYRIRTDEGREYHRNRRVLMKSPESDPSATDISPHLESPTVRTNRSSPSKETADQAVSFSEEPTTTSQEQEEIHSLEDEISEPHKTASGRVVKRPPRFKDYVM